MTSVPSSKAVTVISSPIWHSIGVDEVIHELGLHNEICEQGLSSKEFQERLEKYGPNKFSEKEKITIWMRIWRLCANVLVGILLFVAIVALIKGIIAKSAEDRLTNFIEVGLIVFVIT
jgi:magnesium-transporting ATPase (P-type)